MTQPNWSTERAELERVAQELRTKGYKVLVAPSASEVPDFVREYHPDIIARGSNDNLIVEVKRLLSAAERERIKTIARRVEGHRGWRFMLVTPETGEGQKASDSSERQQVSNWVSEARALVKAGHSRTALVAVWAGVEAAMRVAAKTHSIELTRSDGWSLMRELVSNGVLDRDSYQSLTESFRVRSAFAHGMEPDVQQSVDLDRAVEALAHTAEELVSQQSVAPTTDSE